MRSIPPFLKGGAPMRRAAWFGTSLLFAMVMTATALATIGQVKAQPGLVKTQPGPVKAQPGPAPQIVSCPGQDAGWFASPIQSGYPAPQFHGVYLLQRGNRVYAIRLQNAPGNPTYIDVLGSADLP